MALEGGLLLLPWLVTTTPEACSDGIRGEDKHKHNIQQRIEQQTHFHE
jgi:hypothetical protein